MSGQSTGPHKQWRDLPEGCWARGSFIECSKGNVETGHDWPGGGRFSLKASRPCFVGRGELAKAELEDCDCCLLGFLDREVFP